MKTIHWIFVALTVGLTTFTGCKKAEQVQSYEVQGIKVDVPQLDVAFANASPEAQASAAMFKRNFRYRQYPEALAELARLAQQPALTAPQKKLIENLTAQTKAVVAKSAPAAPGH